LFVAYAVAALAQGDDRVVFRHLNKKDGLAQSSVFAIAQDSLGYLWFGTRGGLSKYDGYRFHHYESDTITGPAGNDIRTLYVDPLTEALWVGSLSSLSRYDEAKNNFTTYRHERGAPRSLTSGAVRCVFRDRAGRLWAGTSRGLNLFDEQARSWSRFFPAGQDTETPANNISFITQDENDLLWIGTRGGLFRYEHRQADGQDTDFSGAAAGAKFVLEASIGRLTLTSGVWSKDQTLWLGTFNQGVRKWNPTTGVVSTYINDPEAPSSLSHNSVRTLKTNDAGDLWVGTFDGLNLLKAGANVFIRYQNTGNESSGLRDYSIRSLLIDRTGSLWVGTYYGGVHHLDERYNRFTNFQHDANRNSLSGNVVSSFAETTDGGLWIGTEGAGLDYLDPTTGSFLNYSSTADQPNTLSGNNVKKLLLDGEDLWIGTFRAGLNRLDTRTGRFRYYRHNPDDPNSLASDNVYGLHREGDLLWILTFGRGLDVLDLTTDNIRHYPHDAEQPNTISDQETRVITKGKDGTFWIGTEQGLNRVVTDAAGYPASFETLFPAEKIYAIHEDKQGRLLLGTFSNGLFRYDPQTKAKDHFTKSDGLPGNTIFGILETDDGMFWLSTDSGLSRFDGTSSFTNYDYSHGLENLEYNFNAYHKAQNGELLFGGLNGFTRFNPTGLTPNTYVPPVVFTGLWRNNQEEDIKPGGGLLTQNINDTKALTFRYGEAAFTIQFAALDYFSPENNRYAYMLKGLDRDWNYTTGESEASYTIQREGAYTFLLKGANSDGVWNPEVRQLNVMVMPPPWRSWWAYLIYLALGLLMVYTLVHFLRLRHKIQLQEIEKKQQDALMEMKLRFFTNITHEFRTPLTLILGPLQQLLASRAHTAEVNHQLSLIDRNAQRLLNLVNQVLTFRKLVTDHEPMKISACLAAPFLAGILDSFRETARLRSIRLAFDNQAPEVELWLDCDKMEKVFFNLLSNAFKFTPDGGHITVHLEEHGKQVLVRVVDSGPGVDPAVEEDIFKRFYEKSTGQQSFIKSSGIGLAISRQMVALHKGEIYVKTPAPDEDRGAEFVVELKKGKAHFKQLDLEEVEFAPLVKNEAMAVSPSLLPSYAPAAAPNEKLPVLLIVEDNPEIRTYVRSIFKDSYSIVEADDGLAGLEQAKKVLPDVIISDVMMPGMDGLAFCHAVKTDLPISHIPIVLLTARAAEPFRIEGLRTGADDYLTKPFHPEELRLRVRNIVRSRQKAREKFARVLSLDPSEVTITNADEEFLERAMAVVEREMSNYDFKVEDFATHLAVSRSLLFTKLKALAGMTPNNFVKSIRLKRAGQLLRSGQFNVSQAAYEVGFKDPKYFRRCFKEQFNESPSSFGKRSG
jgi:signal transduction histidine kinase/ligand-binding sensor domain-containing protein/DNA-binding response OmpR family regulator